MYASIRLLGTTFGVMLVSTLNIDITPPQPHQSNFQLMLINQAQARGRPRTVYKHKTKPHPPPGPKPEKDDLIPECIYCDSEMWDRIKRILRDKRSEIIVPQLSPLSIATINAHAKQTIEYSSFSEPYFYGSMDSYFQTHFKTLGKFIDLAALCAPSRPNPNGFGVCKTKPLKAPQKSVNYVEKRRITTD